MHYSIYPTKDTWISSGSRKTDGKSFTEQNFGKDEILELKKEFYNTVFDYPTRVLVQFDITDIKDSIENLKSTNEIVIHYVDKLPENADTKKYIYVLANLNKGNQDKTEHYIFNKVLNYFGQYEECWNKKLKGDKLKYYGWSSRKSLLDSFKLWEMLTMGRPINKSSGYVSDIDNWVDAGSLKDCIYHSI